MGRDTNTQEEEGGFVAEVVAVPSHQVWREGVNEGKEGIVSKRGCRFTYIHVHK